VAVTHGLVFEASVAGAELLLEAGRQVVLLLRVQHAPDVAVEGLGHPVVEVLFGHTGVGYFLVGWVLAVWQDDVHHALRSDEAYGDDGAVTLFQFVGVVGPFVFDVTKRVLETAFAGFALCVLIVEPAFLGVLITATHNKI
jgi:hypothetical protein